MFKQTDQPNQLVWFNCVFEKYWKPNRCKFHRFGNIIVWNRSKPNFYTPICGSL